MKRLIFSKRTNIGAMFVWLLGTVVIATIAYWLGRQDGMTLTLNRPYVKGFEVRLERALMTADGQPSAERISLKQLQVSGPIGCYVKNGYRLYLVRGNTSWPFCADKAGVRVAPPPDVPPPPNYPPYRSKGEQL